MEVRLINKYLCEVGLGLYSAVLQTVDFSNTALR